MIINAMYSWINMFSLHFYCIYCTFYKFSSFW